jgi:hypothetical protein
MYTYVPQRQLQPHPQTSSKITNESSTSIPESQNKLLLLSDTISVYAQPAHKQVTFYHLSAGYSYSILRLRIFTVTSSRKTLYYSEMHGDNSNSSLFTKQTILRDQIAYLERPVE